MDSTKGQAVAVRTSAKPERTLSDAELNKALAELPPSDQWPKYQPTEHELAAIEAVESVRAGRSPIPRWFARHVDGNYVMGAIHADEELGRLLTMHGLGIASPAILQAIVNQIANLSIVDGVVNESRFNQLLAMVRGVSPQDELEAMMAVQMAAIHDATLTHARQLRGSATGEREEFNERALNKLARTFAVQLETLKKYRTGGEQIVRVERVTVNEGGQAIVGNVSHGSGAEGRGRQKNGG